MEIEESLSLVRRKLIDAEAEVEAAKKAAVATRWRVRYHEFRLLPYRTGIADWILALGVATPAAIILMPPLCLVGGLLGLAAAVVLGYGAGTPLVIWLLADIPGEPDREQSLAIAKSDHLKAIGLIAARGTLVIELRDARNSITAVIRSGAIERQKEEDRLLAVDPGRLYPDEFERYVGEIFRFLGYQIQETGQSGDQGVDIIAERAGVRLAIQAKRYQGSVGNSAVQEVFAGKMHYRCARCIVMSSGEAFTSGATALAQSTGCMLIGKGEIPALLRGELGL